jgi:glycogen synthase
MRIGIVGGIFGKPAGYRAVIGTTLETLLADGLERRGHEVVRLAHQIRLPLADLDLVHVHHLSHGAMAAASEPADVPFVFSFHWFRQGDARRRVAAGYVARRADSLVAGTETEARWQGEEYGIPATRQAVIPNGIDDSVFRFSAPSPPADGRWRLLFVGQLAPFKGVDQLLRALARIRKSHQVRLDLVYQTDTQEAELRRLAAALALEDIGFLGARGHSELAELYAASHVIVLPSISGEALPSVISEAMFVGRPVVGTDVAGVREQLDGFGEVVPPGDPSGLAEGIRRVLDDYPRRADRAEEMSEAARRRFSVAVVVEAHERLYHSLARRRPVRHAPRRRVGTALGRVGLRLAGSAQRAQPAPGP